ncbi:MAG: hypothetical protein AAGM38_13380 [Pseudomonadota bacterium]
MSCVSRRAPHPIRRNAIDDVPHRIARIALRLFASLIALALQSQSALAEESDCLRAHGAGVMAAPLETACDAAENAAPKPAAPTRPTTTPLAFKPDCALRTDCVSLRDDPVLGPIIAEARAVFGVEPDFYLTETAAFGADLPYMLPSQPPFILRDQVHIPRAYREAVDDIGPTSEAVWSFIIGHETAHAYQEKSGLMRSLFLEIGVRSPILIELQADYLGAYFAGRSGGVAVDRAETMVAELWALPQGRWRDPDFHGFTSDRVVALYMGFLAGIPSRKIDLAGATDASLDLICTVAQPSLPPGQRLTGPICQNAKETKEER